MIGSKVVDGSLQGNLEYIHGIVGWVEAVHLRTLNVPYYKLKDNVFMSMLMKLSSSVHGQLVLGYSIIFLFSSPHPPQNTALFSFYIYMYMLCICSA